MFGFLSVLLISALVSFGGMLTHSRWMLAMLSIGGVVVVVVDCCFRRRLLSGPTLLLGGGLVLAMTLPAQVWGPCFVGVWSYMAVCRYENRTTGFMQVLLVIGSLEAVLGFTQYFLLPGWIFGYENEAYAVSGTLINRNHYAGLLNMIVPVACGLAYISVHRFRSLERAYVYLFVGGALGLAVFLSSSRMGIFVFVVTITFLGWTVYRRHTRNRLALAVRG